MEAVAWPVKNGAVSQTRTSKSFPLEPSFYSPSSSTPLYAAVKNESNKSDYENVNTISFELICSWAYLITSSYIHSISYFMYSNCINTLSINLFFISLLLSAYLYSLLSSVFFEDINTVFDGYYFFDTIIVEFRIVYLWFYGHYA